MSSVVIAGDSSGSVTLQAPAVAGSTVVTLPSVSGGTFIASDSSGNVGIGTNSPTVKLDVQGVNGIGSITSTTGTNTVNWRLTNTGGTLYSGIDSSTGGNFTGTAYAGVLWHSGAYPIVFATSNAEKMRLDSSGNLLVGTTTSANSGARLSCASAATPSRTWSFGPDASGNFIVYNSSSVGMYMGWGATSWTANSDERLKTTLVPFDNAAAKVCAIRAGTGRYLADDENVSRSFLIAQDVQAVLPEAVDVQPDEQGTLGLRYQDMIPLLTAAIQEQQAIIEAQAADIAALKEKVGL